MPSQVTGSKKEAAAVESQMKNIARPMYSNPPVSVCVFVRVHAHVYACARACVYVCVSVFVCVALK